MPYSDVGPGTEANGYGNENGYSGGGGWDGNLDVNLPANLSSADLAALEAESADIESGKLGFDKAAFQAALAIPGGNMLTAFFAGVSGGSQFAMGATDPNAAANSLNGISNNTSTPGISGDGNGINGGQGTLEQQLNSLLGINQGGNPITDAAQIQADAYADGQEVLAPYLNAGNNALPALSASATPGGMDQMFSEIMGGNQFKTLLDERTRSAEGALSAGGLTRSGAGVSAMADIPSDLAMQLEQVLNKRNQNLVNTGGNAALGTTSLLSGGAEALASGILGNHEATIAAQNTNTAQQNADDDRRDDWIKWALDSL